MRLKILTLLLLLLPLPLLAQFTTTTASVPALAGASYTFDFINLSGQPTLPLLGGVSAFPTQVVGSFNASGALSASVADNNQVLPLPSQWRLSVVYHPCAAVTLGFNIQQTITGVTQSLTAALAAAVPPTPPACQSGGGGGGGAGNPNGFGTIQTANRGGNAFLSFGQINSDASNTANNGITQTQSTLCGAACSITVPPTSTDTEQGLPLPTLSSLPSSFIIDLRGNRQQIFATNPQYSPSIIDQQPGGPLNGQNLFAGALVYTQVPQPGGVGNGQGGVQGFDNFTVNYASPGFSNGLANCPLYCPQSGYSAVNSWQLDNVSARIFGFYASAIKQVYGWNAGYYGTGDSDSFSLFCTYSGGADAPSDEGHHCFNETHSYSVADSTMTVTSITDANHLKSTFTGIGFGPQGQPTVGQGRFLIKTNTPVQSTTSQSLLNFPVNIIYGPGQNSHPYGTVVATGANFPVSYAAGTMTNACTVPVQDGGVAIGANSGSPGCAVTVTSGTFDTASPACVASNSAKQFNIGMKVSAVTGSVPNQVLTMTMHRSVPAGAYIFQGGMCGAAIDMFGDDNNFNQGGGTLTRGSVFPLIGSLDGNTVVYVAYDASQVWSQIPLNGSFSGSRAIAGAGVGFAGEGFSAINLVRTSNVVTATITSGQQSQPPIYQILNDALDFNVTGCTDPTMNTNANGNEGHIIADFPNTTFQYLQSGGPFSDSTCASAVIALQGTAATYYWAAETYDVENHSNGVQPLNAVDGTFALSYQPNFTNGDTLDQPPNYAAISNIVVFDNELGQPFYNVEGLNIIMGQNAAVGTIGAGIAQAINIVSGINQHFLWSLGNKGFPGQAIHMNGLFSGGLVMDSAPLSESPVIGVGLPFCGSTDCPTSLFRTYDLWNLAGELNTGFEGQYNADTNTFNLLFTRSPIAIWNSAESFWNVPLSMRQATFQTLLNASSPPITFSDFSMMNVDSLLLNTQAQGLPVAYAQSYLPAPTAHAVTTGVTQYVYVILAKDGSGNPKGWSQLAFISNGAVTPNNTISCSILPTGGTGEVYININPNWHTVGACTTPSTIVTDTGTYGPALGNNPTIDFIPLYSGFFAAYGGGAFQWRQNDYFGTSTSPLTITAQFTQPTDGNISLDTGTKGNHSGNLTLNNLTVNGTCTGCAGASVSSLNGLTGALTLVAGANISITPSGSNITIAATGSGGATIQTNGTNNTSQILLNFTNPANFNGLTFTFSNPSGGVETFAVGGTLGNAGLTNSSTTVNGQTCTLGSTCTITTGLISGLTTGFIPKAASATSLNNSHIDDGVTTAGVITATEPVAITGNSSIATGTSSNTDLAGLLTLSGGTQTYTFANTYTSPPVCVATDTTAANAVKASPTTTVLTVTGTGTDVIAYVCIGRN